MSNGQSGSDIRSLKAKPGPVAPGKRSQGKELQLSCQRCRLRKVKCNFAHPCSSCVRLGVECIEVPNDMRKKRPPATYVSTLEKQIDNYQTFFARLSKISDPVERSRFFDTNSASFGSTPLANGKNDGPNQPSLGPHASLPAMSSPESVSDARGQTPEPSVSRSGSAMRSAVSPAPSSNIRPVYGPTSVYENEPETKPKSLTQKKEFREIATLRNLSKDPDVLHCLKLFFTWQYPNHNMFVFREAFFTDFFNPKPTSLYCSSILVLSVCALGARMSDVDTIYTRSLTYYNEAKSSLLSNLEYPSITSVQSFLLLAFYDICNGNNSTGWMLSGNAMRMGFDLGFQLHPEVWFLKHRGVLKDLDVAIRSRIYWGCFMADHFISLVLGRPSLLKFSDASIPETEDLPELDWINEYKYIPDNKTNISDPLKNIINLISISDNMLTDIFTKSDNISNEETNHANDDYDLISRLSKLYDYNAQIVDWKKNLPPDLNWDRDNLNETSDNPTILVVRYYYYILLLCLNRPFVGIVRDFKDKEHFSPASVCSNAIDDLYVAIKKFQDSHGLRRASIFIVYCSILSISVILLTSTTNNIAPDKKAHLKYFMSVLEGCSKTWKLAEKSHKMIELKLMLQFSDDPDFSSTEPSIGKKPRAKRQKKSAITTAEPNVSTEREAYVDQAPGKWPSPVLNAPALTSAASESSYDGSQVDSSVPLEESILTKSELDQISQANTEFFGGPPVLMTSDLFNEDWEALFPDSIFSQRFGNSQ